MTEVAKDKTGIISKQKMLIKTEPRNKFFKNLIFCRIDFILLYVISDNSQYHISAYYQ